MARYSGDYGGSAMRYGRDYRPWSGSHRYDREHGRPERQAGHPYDRGQAPWRRPGPYDRDLTGYRGHGGMAPYDRGYMERWQRPARGGAAHGGDRFRWEERVMDGRPYPSPWDERHAGMTFGYGLGFGQGRGQFIYK